uniref:BAH domain-containing protein n=1 Tax=Mesocestoides corti TaxID=53468 RepID=A0A5K3F3Z2_MESCO
MDSDVYTRPPEGHGSERAYRRKRPGRTDAENLDTAVSTKKSLRPRSLINKSKLQSGSSNSKCRSRRHVFKTNPSKLGPPQAFIRLENRVLNKGNWLHIGDIVSVTDVEGGQYYAQLRSIIVDNLDNVSVILTWLVPTTEATSGKFDLAHYVIGMEEDLPRHIDCVMFVCRCSSDYFRPIDTPYTIQSWNKVDQGPEK